MGVKRPLILAVYHCSGRGGETPDVYAVDATDVEQWDAKVLQPALEIVEAYLKVITSEILLV